MYSTMSTKSLKFCQVSNAGSSCRFRRGGKDLFEEMVKKDEKSRKKTPERGDSSKRPTRSGTRRAATEVEAEKEETEGNYKRKTRQKR